MPLSTLLSTALLSKAAPAALGALVLAAGATAAVAVPVGLAASHGPAHQQEALGDDSGSSTAGSATDGSSSDPADQESESATDESGEPSGDATLQLVDQPTGSPTATRGPDATGPAAFGLCTAWAHGGLSSAKADAGNPAAAALVAAAGDSDVETYCAEVLLATKGTASESPTATDQTQGDAVSQPQHTKKEKAHGNADAESHRAQAASHAARG